jgi:Concanavalin A-like lectin/glucanases superfamily
VARAARLRRAVGVVLLVGAACAVVQWEPWHGPIILSLSTDHGIHLADLLALPLLALTVAVGHAWMRERPQGAGWPTGRFALPAAALLLGALLLLAPIDETTRRPPLLPAGGGTFGGNAPEHADARRSDPVNRWSHLALTYDGASLRLYLNGAQVASRAVSGDIKRTKNPLWIGGNHPYGEYFDGLIDEVRVYDRVLTPSELRAEMSTPIASSEASPAAGLVGAYAFDRGAGSVAADSSGNGNTGAILGATWTTRGRFGGALRFNGNDDTVRIPASPSLDLRHAMTLSAWSRPAESQRGWRTILHRQTDAYFLDAGGGTYEALGTVDDARAALLVGAALWFCLMLALTPGRRASGRSWWPGVALFLAGSLIDAAVGSAGTLFGPTLVAAWYALTASRRGEAVGLYLITVLFAAVTLVSLGGGGSLDLARNDGGTARAVALGALFVVAGLLGARYRSREATRDS